MAEDIHEVVHISRAPITRGLMKAKIRRQNIMEVIKPRDQIFLGHKIPDCVVSANLQDEIVRRALKCTEKPSIVFDYHYRYTYLKTLTILLNYFQDQLRIVLQYDPL